MPPCTWIARRAHRYSSSAANASAIVAARCRSVQARRRSPSTRSSRRRARAPRRAACRRTGAARPGRSRSGASNCSPLLRVLDRDLERAGRGADAVDHRGDREPVDGLGDGERRVADAESRWPGTPSSVTVPSLRVPSTVGVRGDGHARRVRRRLTNTPSPPSASVAVTNTRSAASRSRTCAFVPSMRHPSPSATAVVGGRRHSARRPGSSTRPCRSSRRRRGRGATSRGRVASPASTTRLTAPTAVDANGPGYTRPTELLEHDRHVDHPHAGAAVHLGDQQPDDAERRRARPDVVGRSRARRRSRSRTYADRRAARSRKRRTRRRAAAPVVGELEVQRCAPELDLTRRQVATYRVRSGRATALRRGGRGVPRRARRVARRARARAGAAARAQAARAPTCPTGPATGSATLFDARLARPRLAAGARRPQRHRVEQMIYFEEMSQREIPRSLNPQGLGIIAPSIRTTGRPSSRSGSCCRRCGPRSRGASG